MAARVTQEVVETFAAEATAGARVTQEAVEVFAAEAAASARVTQLVIEVFWAVPDVAPTLPLLGVGA